MTPKAWLGLGGNIGDVQTALAAALQNLHEHEAITVTAVSLLYKTPPWGVEDQPFFLNCCAEVTTSLSPAALFVVCQEQERIGKRERNRRWGPRTIDIDILVFEGLEQDNLQLTLPHPRMLGRSFVLVPLADIAPHLTVSQRQIADWAADSDQSGLELMDAAANWWQQTKPV